MVVLVGNARTAYEAHRKRFADVMGNEALESQYGDLEKDPDKYLNDKIPGIVQIAQAFKAVLAEEGPPAVLEGVICRVDVRIADDSRDACRGIKDALESLGAKVVGPKAKATHLVFKDGLRSTYDRAAEEGLTIVTSTWVTACEKAAARLDEKDFAARVPKDVVKRKVHALF